MAARYFFTVHGPDQQSYSDHIGEFLTDDAAAISHAKKVARELASGADYDGWHMSVTDERGRGVSTIVF